ncbi:MAG: hypothetical protein U0J65_04995 [Christensenellales bacterium]|nr:hypothetical protein [Christensenellales bacterium]
MAHKTSENRHEPRRIDKWRGFSRKNRPHDKKTFSASSPLHAQKMKETCQENCMIVYSPAQQPQDIVDNCCTLGRATVDKLHFLRKNDRRKSLENKAFF